MPAERSGQNMFDFQYGEEFGEHIETLRPRLHQGARPLQPRRRRRGKRRAAGQAQAPGRLAALEGPQVPLRAARARRGRPARGRRRRHRALRRRAAPRADAPCDRRDPGGRASRSTSGRSRASTSAPTARCSPPRPAAGGREGVVCVVLGRGADDDKVDHWLRAGRARRGLRRASPSVARSGGTRSRTSSTARSNAPPAARQIAENYLRFVEVYERAEGKAPVG